MNKSTSVISSFLSRLHRPDPNSHKGQNGKLLVIGGSRLFHAAIFWAADAASRIVDMVHFTSPENENNDLVRFKLKQAFWNGIVIDWGQVESYVQEDDVVLIGPGMERSAETKMIINTLLAKFPDKKWVIDGGALQMVDAKLLGSTHLLTPHQGEMALLEQQVSLPNLIEQGVTILAKSQTDIVYSGKEKISIDGGNPGMTKGGTGDVLAGVVAALYCTNEAVVAAVVGSQLVNAAGDRLWKERGQYYNAGDLVDSIKLPK